MKKWMILLIVICCATRLSSQRTVKVTCLSSEGPPMLFLPHIGCSSEMWKGIAIRFHKSYACYLVDFAGFDTLPAMQSPPYTEAYVRDLTHYLKESKLKNSILVGQNYGAFVAVKVSQDKSLGIKALITSDFYPKLSMVIDTLITQEKLQAIQTSIRNMIIKSDSTAFIANQEQTARMMNFSDTVVAARFVEWQRHSDRRTLAETLCEQFAENLLPVLESNRLPVLAFSTWYFAKTYKHMPVSEAGKHLDRMYGKTPKVRHAITEHARDFMASDQPEWFISEMNSFLKQYGHGE